MFSFPIFYFGIPNKEIMQKAINKSYIDNYSKEIIRSKTLTTFIINHNALKNQMINYPQCFYNDKGEIQGLINKIQFILDKYP